MDAEEVVRVVESMEKAWPDLEKNVICIYTNEKKEKVMTLVCEIGRLHVLLRLIIGKRGGLCEQVTVIDPSKKLTVDQLIFAQTTTLGDGILLPLVAMRKAWKHKASRAELIGICWKAMEDKLRIILDADGPDWWYRLQCELLEPASDSLHSQISAGAPGQGKNH